MKRAWMLAVILIFSGIGMVGCGNKTAKQTKDKAQTETDAQSVAGQAKVTCHIEGEILNDKYGYDLVICVDGKGTSIYDDPSYHVKAVNGKFSTTIECDRVDLILGESAPRLWLARS